MRCRGKAMRAPDALHRGGRDAGRLCHHRRRPVRRLGHRRAGRPPARHSGSERRYARGAPLVAQQASTPSSAKQSCQRQTQVFALPGRRMISTVPSPSAEKCTISARQPCFCGVLRSRTSASRRRRSAAERSMLMPVRMRQTRMPPPAGESLAGCTCQISSNSETTARSLHFQARPRAN